MYWNYRIRQIDTEVLGAGSVTTFDIIEAHYDDETDNITGWISSRAEGNDLEDLRGELENMLAAFDSPVVNHRDLPGVRPACSSCATCPGGACKVGG